MSRKIHVNRSSKQKSAKMRSQHAQRVAQNQSKTSNRIKLLSMSDSDERPLAI
ncbi:hypothetical protein [Pontibacter sp. G13]|uniref:hypothetical protein n=1 Tax=Pontibacter sp. G13 TaxID=3074898 RepID=UPI0028895ABA|nr:hypothetical protein [Pontibacter sp. G13]WNJ16221.1 hypothetical protein RJD25_15260 [Pontibacter sp. G13]